MKLVIDLQGAQAANRSRGIGRYSLALARGIARHAGRHEIWVALNGGFSDSIEDIRRSFEGLLPKERIAVWHAPARVASIDPANEWRRQVGERLREEFLASLRPDVVHITSLFEGLVDDALTSISPSDGPTSTTVTLHDLIPLVHRDLYLKTPRMEAWYENKTAHLKRAPLLLANSESSRQEGIRWLKLPEQRIVNISAAADDIFRPLALAADQKAAIRRQYGLPRNFVMYTGGIELRKNIERLIQAYATLPANLRQQHQLAIVCQIEAADLHRLRALGRKTGLADDELVFTGRVPDDDLVALYNECSVFVFPSWHEGFGLPALEAMKCGAAVIAANGSSLPEVVGRADALFDPLSEKDIAAKLHAVLTDAAFREQLRVHGLRQAAKFSWDATAKRALEGLERLVAKASTASPVPMAKPRPSLAYVSPLPPAQTGIADYSAELLRELHRHYEIDVIVAQKEISDDWVLANCARRNVAQFRQNADRYDRILYHFGNSVFHQHMFDLLERHPGTVVLHDLYLSGILSNIELFDPGSWIRSLYESHGYAALRDPPRADNRIDIAYKFPCSLDVIRRANGVIVHSEFSKTLADQWYGEGTSADWIRIPHLRQPEPGANRAAARAALVFSEQDFVVCSFGSIGPAKLNDRLLTAWLSAMKGDQRCHLVFVGEDQSSPYGADLLRAIDREGLSERVKITGYASPELYRSYLAAADCAVQLRSMFRGETSGAILDCLNYGIPTIVNAHGPMGELDPDAVLLLADRFDDADLAAALSRIRQDAAFRRSLSERARAYIATTHNPVRIGEQYREAIEHFAAAGPLRHRINLLRNLPQIDPPPRETTDWKSVARTLVLNHPLKTVARHLFVDVSEFIATNYVSGVQRVVRSVLNELLGNPPAGFRIEPVYTGADGVYRYARRFTVSFMGGRDSRLTDDVVDAAPGDVFIGLDYCPHLVPRSRRALEQMAQRGASIYFMVYDLLCIQRPEFFIPHERTVKDFVTWLNAISRHADGLIAISRSVANDLMQWLEANAGEQRIPPVGWFHLGSDFRSGQQAGSQEPGQTGEVDAALLPPRAHPSVLMVGTIEPRKGYAEVLAAFDSLWHSGVEANLVIAGRRGWMTDTLINHLLGHPMAGKRLFWFSEASDAMVLKLYDTADGLLMASEAEGFGLPLIEAARNGLPILARDIPVFREVAGDHATYFSGRTPFVLADEINAWLKQLAAGQAVPSRDMPWSTWAQSTTRLMELVLDSKNERWR